MNAKFKLIGAAAAAVVALMILSGSFFTIDETERGVKTRMGVVVGTVEPGFGLKAPFIESVKVYDVKVQKETYEGVQALSKDLQAANINLSVNFQIDPAGVENIYRQLGRDYVERVVDPAVFNTTKATFGKYTSSDSVKDYAVMSEAMTAALSEELLPYGISVRAVQITTVGFSPEFLNTVEDRMKAEVEVQKTQQNLAREKVQADILRTQADAEAYASLAKSSAEAKGINLRGEALRANQSLVELTKAEKWDGKLPTTMIPSAAVPFLDVSPAKN